MSALCHICHTPRGEEGGLYSNNATLASGKTLGQMLKEILGDNAVRPRQDITGLCKNCYLRVLEYHGLSERLHALITTLQTIFFRARTLSPSDDNVHNSPVQIRLPKSSLRPLSSQYMFLNKSELNTGKLTSPVKQPLIKSIASAAKPSTTTTATISQLAASRPPMKQLTIDGSLLTKLSEAKSTLTDELEDVNAPKAEKTTSMLDFGVGNLPKDFLDTSVSSRANAEDAEVDVELHDGQAMEIDEDCMLPAGRNDDGVTTNKSDTRSQPDSAAESSSDQNVFEVNIVPHPDQNEDSDDQFVVKKVEILDDEDAPAGEQTLLVESEDGALIRVMAGQKFMYGDDEISLIIPGDEDDLPDNDNADSNDESQIELQVSGDEETANAIIAAAREQGGAFIKVQSGEMYRVKSVKSKIKEESQTEAPDQPLQKFSDFVKEMDNSYKCLICSKDSKRDGTRLRMFHSRDGAMRHLRVSHGVDLPADKLFTPPTEDRTSPPTKKGGHQCRYCQKSYGSRNLLREHLNQHTGLRPYTCEECGKTFASKYTHQAHLKTHQERPRPFKCTKEGCGKCFLTQQNLTQHELTHAGVKEFVCQICGKAFGTAHNLEVHGVVHSGLKPFRCNICNKSFARKAEIRDHIRTHTGERPFACDICGATFSQRSNLQSHVRATHIQDKRHACTECEKKFKRRRLLEYHIKACHTGERPYKCDVCTATFVYPEHYKKHALIHSGERPYVCEVCGKSFNSRDNRNAHRFVHSDKKPYECLVCGAGYMRKPLLYAHMHASGHMTESIVVNQPRVSSDEQGETILEAVDNDLDIVGRKNIGKSSVIQDPDSAIITLAQNLEGASKIEPSILESFANEDLGKGAEIVAKDENGSVVRLVQIQLPNGDNGWIAIN